MIGITRQAKPSRLTGGLIALVLGFSLAGCAQTPAIILDDSANIRHHEQLEMVPEPSGKSTDQGLMMDMEGGG
jgi:hypothetical protein